MPLKIVKIRNSINKYHGNLPKEVKKLSDSNFENPLRTILAIKLIHYYFVCITMSV